MIKKLVEKKVYFFILLILILFTLLTLANYQYSKMNPGGTDFLVHWVGTKSILEEGISPYSDQTALRIQTLAYGRPAVNGEHELRVTYPLYSILFFTPFTLAKDFIIARAFWMTVLEFALYFIVVLSLRITNWKVRTWMLCSFLLFGFFFYHGIRPLINGNIIILVTLLVLLALLAIRNGQDEIAGVLLAFSTVKPNIVILLLFYIFLWALFKHRTKIIFWFSGAIVLLVGFSLLLIPDWLIQNLHEILRYPTYSPPGSPGAAMVSQWGAIGTRFSIGLTIILSLILIFEWWKGRNCVFKQFLWTVMVTMVISQWIGIQTDPGNFILLLPALFIGFEFLWERWKERAFAPIITVLTLLFIGIWVLFLTTLNQDYQPIQNSLLFFPFPFVVLTLLYWSRWWVIRSIKIKNEEQKIGIFSQ